MKTRLAALAVLLMAGTAPAALAQDQDRHERGAGEQRPAGVPHEHHGGGGQWGGGERAQRPASTPQSAPQVQQAPQAQPAPQAPEPRPNFGGGGRWGGHRTDGQQQVQPQFQPQPGQPVQARPDRRPGGDDGQRYVRRPGTWVDRDAEARGRDASPADRRDRGEPRQWTRFGGGNPGAPAADHRGDRRDGNRGGDRQWNGGDHRDGDRRDGDRRWDGNRDHSNGYRDNHGRPEWRPGAYPHSFHSNQRFHWRSYVRPPHFYAHLWSFGEFLPSAWYGAEYVIEDWWDFGLPAPPYGYVWVRVGDDALLIDDYDGRVVQVVRELFW